MMLCQKDLTTRFPLCNMSIFLLVSSLAGGLPSPHSHGLDVALYDLVNRFLAITVNMQTGKPDRLTTYKLLQ